MHTIAYYCKPIKREYVQEEMEKNQSAVETPRKTLAIKFNEHEKFRSILRFYFVLCVVCVICIAESAHISYYVTYLITIVASKLFVLSKKGKKFVQSTVAIFISYPIKIKITMFAT